jgi:hypothetical protein
MSLYGATIFELPEIVDAAIVRREPDNRDRSVMGLSFHLLPFPNDLPKG